ncbi:hypothetical protein [Tissierella sp. Yu-01]|uniref:hypothetical protein n=1 Tax=Tissierella sp. Yu-01 TaxID=3035694 RepID=UPI00240D7549|nr:hypothetical protein [Tissierella sp. Yu-01]WFA08917.1 hypothetical protein P3962_14505 [Tissierella sp. Yu-01]
MIQCSEKCIHENDGLCNLKEVTHPSATPMKDCPYYSNREIRSSLTSNKEDNNVIPPPYH